MVSVFWQAQNFFALKEDSPEVVHACSCGMESCRNTVQAINAALFLLEFPTYQTVKTEDKFLQGEVSQI